jgi:hypothetical protein
MLLVTLLVYLCHPYTNMHVSRCILEQASIWQPPHQGLHPGTSHDLVTATISRHHKHILITYIHKQDHIYTEARSHIYRSKITTSMKYSFFSAQTCIDGYWSPKDCDDLLNSSQILLFFVTDVHWWIWKPKISQRFVNFVTIRPTTPWHLSKFVAIGK